MKKTTTFNLSYFLFAVFGVLMLHNLWVATQTVAPIPYSDFQTHLKANRIKEVVITAQDIRGEFTEPVDGKSRFVTTRVEGELAALLAEHKVTFSGQVDSAFLATLLSWIVPVLFFFAIWALFARRMADRLGGPGGMLSIGKSKAKIYVETDTKTTFSDVAGVDEAKAELQEIVEFLKDPKSKARLGARMPKGILLVGPPGTGKTLLARAVAGEAGVPFFSISGSEFVEMFVGVGAARVRDLFEQARQKAPAIIFIDELDAMGRARNSVPGMGGHDEKEQTLNQLLVELDGFDATSGIVLVGATNRPEILDPALLRAGRFDRQVLVDRPDRVGRVQILKVYLPRVTVASDVDPEAVAALTPGFAGADLANLVNEAALVATRRGAERVAMVDFTTAVERIVAGLEKKNRLLIPREREIVAYHEMGHALVAAGMPGADPVHKVSIIPRGIGALGYTIQRPTEDRFLMTKEELLHKMSVLLGGRAAEQVVYGHWSTGASDDLVRTADIARSMVTRYGMVPELGHLAYDRDRPGFLGHPGAGMAGDRGYSEQTAQAIDTAVRDLVDLAFAAALEVLQRDRDVLERSAQLLLEKETLDEAQLRELFEGRVSGSQRGGQASIKENLTGAPE
ncbi:MAG: ATP-dependent zinc metalloprotease FtsH [Vicinamibacterales bacterium]|nr:ATP-dependent zinc metalloprotease FtsH [Vicinamibacterales bacterium]